MSNEQPADPGPGVDKLEALYNDTTGDAAAGLQEEANVAKAKRSVRADHIAAEQTMVQEAVDFAATRTDNYMGQVHQVLSEAEQETVNAARVRQLEVAQVVRPEEANEMVSPHAQQAEVETARARPQAVEAARVQLAAVPVPAAENRPPRRSGGDCAVAGSSPGARSKAKRCPRSHHK